MAAAKSSTSSSKPVDKTVEKVAAEVQEAVDAAEEAGHLGVDPDPTPNSHYTLSGVAAGKPTPESDAEQARKVRHQLDDAARQG
jgi:hypothetical protein